MKGRAISKNHRGLTRSATRSWSRQVVVLVLGLLWLTLPLATATAQDDKKEQEVTAFKREKKERPKADASTKPGFKAKADEREFKLISAKKRDEAIRLLKDLIDATDDGDPEKPEFLFQVAELYWQKGKYYEQKAFRTQDEMYEAQDRNDRAQADRLKRQMQDELAEAKRLREETVKVYVEIIKKYENFEQLPKVYYFLGANLIEVGKRPQALGIFRELIKKYPDTEFVPNVLLAFGEYYFDNDDMQQAMKAYEKVMSFKGSAIRNYAAYKLAWCYYNLTYYDKALDQFLDVVKETERAKHANDKALRKEALRDIVLTYTHIGTPGKAIRFFERLVRSKSDVFYMSERLAQLYADSGKFVESTALYQKLIALNKKSFKVMDYQLEIVRNVEALGVKLDTVREVLRAMALFEATKGYQDAKPEQVTQIRQRLELILREYATTYHREAQETRNDETYALAYELYKSYLNSYPDSKDAYIMTFFYGELLYRLKKFDEAAVQYDNVIDMDPQGRYTKEAVHAAVLSYQKALTVSEDLPDSPDLEIPEAGSEGDTTPNSVPPKKVLTQEEQNLIKACERYIKYNPEGESVVKVKYSAARLYFDKNHFESAVPRFEDIVQNHSSHRLAVISANLHLDALLLTNQFDELDRVSNTYRENPSLSKDAVLMTRINGIAEKSTFRRCNALEDKKQWEAAAKCFTDFYRKFPNSDLVDKALYNAALDYERIKQIGKAIDVRKGLLQLRPNSDLVPTTLFNIGGNYHAIAVYSEASNFYELFVKHFPKDEKAEEALRNAATFRQGLGQYERAIADYEHYMTLFPQKKKECAEVFFQIGVIYENEEKTRQAFDQYSDYARKWAKVGKADRVLEAHTKMGMILWESGKIRQAKQEFDKTLKIYKGMREGQRADLTSGADAAAQARFMQGQAEFLELTAIKLKLPERVLQQQLVKKIKGYEEARKIYFDVFKFGRPDWTIASLYRIGSLFQDFANEIRNSPLPAGLTYDQEEIYRSGLEEKAAGIETGAIESYEKCLEAAQQASWFNEYSKKCEVALGDLLPQKYRKPSELRAPPTKYKPGFRGAPFKKDAVHEVEKGLVAESK